MKITIVGNSVALRVRPPQKHPANKNYTYLLREILGDSATIENKALGATTISNWLENIDGVINSFADIYIINIGVVDATIREVPLWYYRLANKKSDNFFTKTAKASYRNLISRFRPLFSLIRGKRAWVTHRRFVREYDQFIGLVIKDTNSKIIALSINLANDRIEQQLPGTKKNHIAFNEAIKDITEKYSQDFLDLNDLSSETHYPDGVHFNVIGHQEVAKRLAIIINKIIK